MMHGSNVHEVMPGVWQFNPERTLSETEQRKRVDDLISLLDQKIADYQNLRRNAQ